MSIAPRLDGRGRKPEGDAAGTDGFRGPAAVGREIACQLARNVL
jgi:hypothetical protein